MWYIIIVVIVLFVFVGCKNKKEIFKDLDIYYICLMDLQVVEYKLGKCFICKMDLMFVKKKNGESKDEL